MEQNKRRKILWIIAIIILLVAFLLWVLRTSDQGPGVNENINPEPPVFTPPSVNLEYKKLDVVKENPTEFSVLNLAKAYTARFGSWSTDNQGTNIEELLPLSTARMQNYLANIEYNFDVEEFSGNTTKSLNAKIIDLSDNSAEVLVTTQKITTKADLTEDVYYQEVQVNLVKSADKWLVDQVIWK